MRMRNAFSLSLRRAPSAPAMARPYRNAVPVETALAIIKADVGRAFDADCLRALRASLGTPEECAA